MSVGNSAKRIFLGLFFFLSLQVKTAAQSTDSVSVPGSDLPKTEEPNQVKNSKESGETPDTEKANHKLIAAVCLFIITTTLLLYHVRSK